MLRAFICSLLAVTMTAIPMAPAFATSTSVGSSAQDTASPDTDARVRALQQQYTDAQVLLTSYQSSRDAEELRAARELLTSWLSGHEALYGVEPRAVEVRGPVLEQVAAIDQTLAPTASATPPPPTPPPENPPPARSPEGGGMIAGGAVMLSLGLVSGLLIGIPLWDARNRALDRADEQRYYIEEQRFIGRAERREVAAVVMFAIGGTLTAAGLPLVVLGGIKRGRSRRRVSLHPAIGPGYTGLGATLRF